jgi:hypothetical protein
VAVSILLSIQFSVFYNNSFARNSYDIEALDDLLSIESDTGLQSFLLENYGYGGLTPYDLMSSGVFDPAEILAPFDSQHGGKFWSEYLASSKSRLGYRIYSRAHNDINSSYYVDWLNPGSELLIDLKSDNGRQSLNRRMFSYWNPNLNLAAGNYSVSEGYGLTIGRYDYRPSSGFSNNSEFDFVYPVNSLYNGFKLVISNDNISNRIYYSDKIYDNARKRFIGTGFRYISSIIDFGAVAGLNYFKFDKTKDQKLAVGINWNIHDKLFEFGGEYAVINQSGGILLNGIFHLNSTDIKANFWHYGNRFENYNCSGMAASDYNSFYAHESHWSAGWQVWKQSLENKINSLLAMRMYYPVVDSLIGYFQMNYADKRSSSYSWVKAGLKQNRVPLLENTGAKLHYQNNKLSHDLSYAFIDLTRNLNKYIEMSLKLRTYFNGNLRWLFCERAFLAHGFRINAEVIISNGLRGNVAIEKLL